MFVWGAEPVVLPDENFISSYAFLSEHVTSWKILPT
jgi:hypothetical protein